MITHYKLQKTIKLGGAWLREKGAESINNRIKKKKRLQTTGDYCSFKSLIILKGGLIK